MRFAKLLDGGLIYAKKDYIEENGNIIFNFNSDEELMKQYGFKPVREVERPQYPCKISYIENDDEIVEIIVGDFEEYKRLKYLENDEKADKARYNQEFEIVIQNKNCIFDTSSKTQSDLLTAFAVCSAGSTYDGWITNNGVELNLTLEDVALISNTFKELSNIYPKWNQFKEMIDEAQTIEELENIKIEY